MTQLQHAILQQMLRSASAGRTTTVSSLVQRLGAGRREVVADLDALDRAGLCGGLRLTLPGLALAVASRRRRRPAPGIAVAA
jgi:predicted DNA-binding transcriptional regulator YafY